MDIGGQDQELQEYNYKLRRETGLLNQEVSGSDAARKIIIIQQEDKKYFITPIPKHKPQYTLGLLQTHHFILL